MNKVLSILLAVVSVILVYTAYWFWMEAQPTFPIIPMGMCWLSGVAIRQAFE